MLRRLWCFKGGDDIKKLYKNVLIICFVVTILFLSGCGNKLKSGEVYEKKFEPEHQQIIMTTIYHTGVNGTVYPTFVPFIYYYDDDYIIKIKSGDEKATYHVDKETYDSVEVGDYFEYNKDSCDDEASYTKERTE